MPPLMFFCSSAVMGFRPFKFSNLLIILRDGFINQKPAKTLVVLEKMIKSLHKSCKASNLRCCCKVQYNHLALRKEDVEKYNTFDSSLLLPISDLRS